MARSYNLLNKRRVNTCIECRRQKKRCNRQLPCHACSVRGTPEQCKFPEYEGSSTPISPSAGPRPTNKPHQDFAVDNRVVSDQSPTTIDNEDAIQLPSQLGYQVNQHLTDQLQVPSELRVPELTSHSSHDTTLIRPRRVGRDKWSRYCEICQNLPDEPIIQGLVDVFFCEANWYFTVLDRRYFDTAHRQWLLHRPSKTDINDEGFMPDDVFFPALLQQTVAVAIQFVPGRSMIASLMQENGITPSDELSQIYSDAGESILDLLGRHHQSIVAVQADLMRCAWLKNSGQGSRAWFTLGSAIRQAQDIGLHLEPAVSSPDSPTSSLDELWSNETKRRLWACLFTWESHMALQLGRPCAIQARDCTIAMLIDADIPREPSRTLFQPQSANDGPPKSSSQIIKYVLGQKIQYLMASHAFKASLSNYLLIRATHLEVDNLLRTLSPCLQMPSADTSWDAVRPDTVLHRLNIAIITNSFLLAIHRPHVKRHRESLDAAVDAASKVLAYSQLLFEKLPEHQHKTFTLIFYTIDAGILAAAIVAVLPLDDTRRVDVSRQLRIAVSRLTILGRRNTAAVAGSKVLSRCVQNLVTNNHSSGGDIFNAHAQLVQAAFPDQCGSQPGLDIAGRLQAPESRTISEHEDVPHVMGLDDWDFLPKFDSPDDLLTAMTIDSGYTSAWLEHSMENMTPWDEAP